MESGRTSFGDEDLPTPDLRSLLEETGDEAREEIPSVWHVLLDTGSAPISLFVDPKWLDQEEPSQRELLRTMKKASRMPDNRLAMPKLPEIWAIEGGKALFTPRPKSPCLVLGSLTLSEGGEAWDDSDDEDVWGHGW